jgi:hypothetical protein
VASVSRGRRAWLSITPEPERELPRAIATLQGAGARPDPGRLRAERRRAERLVLRGSRRAWSRWIAGARRLAERGGSDEDARVRAAARHALDVIDNHDALLLGPERRRRRESERSR